MIWRILKHKKCQSILNNSDEILDQNKYREERVLCANKIETQKNQYKWNDTQEQRKKRKCVGEREIERECVSKKKKQEGG